MTGYKSTTKEKSRSKTGKVKRKKKVMVPVKKSRNMAGDVPASSSYTSEESSAAKLIKKVSCIKRVKRLTSFQNEIFKKKLIQFLQSRIQESSIPKINIWENYLYTAKKTFLERYRRARKIQENLNCDDFIFLKLLNQGTFGEVLMAMKNDSEHFHAIKKLDKKKLVKKDCLEHVRCEKLVLAALNFPFVINLEYFYQTENSLFYVLPLMIGSDLNYLLSNEEKMKENTARFYSSQVILSLEYLHYIGIAHRDIKPENIALDVSGYIKLVDFGFSKILHYRTYTLCGTPEYMAPEILNNKGYGKWIDWWSFGIFVYELCAGYTPFYANKITNIFEKISYGMFEFPGHFSKELKHFIECLLKPDITKRFGIINNSITFIKSHVWFDGLNWNSILNRKLPAPYVPQISKIGKLKHIEIEEETINEEDANLLRRYEHWFKEF